VAVLANCASSEPITYLPRLDVSPGSRTMLRLSRDSFNLRYLHGDVMVMAPESRSRGSGFYELAAVLLSCNNSGQIVHTRIHVSVAKQ